MKCYRNYRNEDHTVGGAATYNPQSYMLPYLSSPPTLLASSV